MTAHDGAPTGRSAEPASSGVRLSKRLADAGVASRRAAEALIVAGRVGVNGAVVTQLGSRVLASDAITVDGTPLAPASRRTYVLVYKPVGYVSTARDPEGRPTVVELAPSVARLYPVGRLDYDSEGLVLLTDDGELTLRLTHPRYGVTKEYHALVQGRASAAQLAALRAGPPLDDGPTSPVEAAALRPEGAATWLRIRIDEGRNRQVRRMCEAVGLQVVRLIRTRLGILALGSLTVGQRRTLTDGEVRTLRRSVGLEAR